MHRLLPTTDFTACLQQDLCREKRNKREAYAQLHVEFPVCSIFTHLLLELACTIWFESTTLDYFTCPAGGRHRAASLSTLNFSPVNSRCEAIVVGAEGKATSIEKDMKRGRCPL